MKGEGEERGDGGLRTECNVNAVGLREEREATASVSKVAFLEHGFNELSDTARKEDESVRDSERGQRGQKTHSTDTESGHRVTRALCKSLIRIGILLLPWSSSTFM